MPTLVGKEVGHTGYGTMSTVFLTTFYQLFRMYMLTPI